jgi:hypothetical protein
VGAEKQRYPKFDPMRNEILPFLGMRAKGISLVFGKSVMLLVLFAKHPLAPFAEPQL